MPTIIEKLGNRLNDKGLSHVEINKLITDTFNTTLNKNNLSTSSIQKALTDLGWEEQFIDSHTLGLIFLCLEDADSF